MIAVYRTESGNVKDAGGRTMLRDSLSEGRVYYARALAILGAVLAVTVIIQAL